MPNSSIAALLFLTGLCLSAWLAARTWQRKLIHRFLPVAYCFVFGLAYSVFVLDSTLIMGLLHSLMASIVGLVIVFGLWVELGSRSSGGD